MKGLISLLRKTANRQRSSSSSTRFRAATQDKFRFRSRAHGARERGSDGRAAGVRLQYDVVRMYCNSMHLRPLSRCLNAWICISVKLGCVLCNFVEKGFGAMSHFEPSVNLMFAYLARPTHLIFLLIPLQTRQICSPESVRNFFFVVLF